MKLKLEKLGPNNCAGGACPTLYRSNDGRYFVQGYITDAANQSDLQIPLGESLVEINVDLIKSIKEQV